MNYLELDNPRPFSKLFMYIDTFPDYGADTIFVELGIKFKILAEYTNPLYPKYRPIIISINKNI